MPSIYRPLLTAGQSFFHQAPMHPAWRPPPPSAHPGAHPRSTLSRRSRTCPSSQSLRPTVRASGRRAASVLHILTGHVTGSIYSGGLCTNRGTWLPGPAGRRGRREAGEPGRERRREVVAQSQLSPSRSTSSPTVYIFWIHAGRAALT